ncbi:hypothetical protein EYF80_047429 [Liparis tanakae]|uniref:Uncharacterized protein n=1 Tax=Liparis tanakae TaxID=230148 RepID=A0A4Z2FME1_9TELE|nr:hypothetical protein EYF80_047429 [Liparis tanakae]
MLVFPSQPRPPRRLIYKGLNAELRLGRLSGGMIGVETPRPSEGLPPPPPDPKEKGKGSRACRTSRGPAGLRVGLRPARRSAPRLVRRVESSLLLPHRVARTREKEMMTERQVWPTPNNRASSGAMSFPATRYTPATAAPEGGGGERGG